MKQIPIAVQVYSVRQEAEADFAGTMKRLAQMGYDGVELAGLYGKTVEEIGTVLKENGLTAVSAHVPVEEFEKDLEGTLDTYAALGCKWLAIPWLGEDRRFGAERYEETLKLIGFCITIMILSFKRHRREFIIWISFIWTYRRMCWERNWICAG